jgi:metalloendopeptidase OMA1, mitochondrial
MTIRYRLPALALLPSLIALPGCDTLTPEIPALLSTPSDGGGSILPGDIVPDRVVDALSVWFFDAQKRRLEEEGKISQDPRYVEPATRVFEHVRRAAAQSEYAAMAEAVEWELIVVEDEKVHVGCFPGGKVVVYTGIFDLAENEAALAAVLGHEAIHVLARHADQRITRDLIAGLPISAIAVGTAADPDDLDPEVTIPVMAALGMGIFKGVHEPFSRELESEADQQGMLLAASAGYDPEAGLNFWINLAERTDSEYYLAHPTSDRRIEDLQSRWDMFRVAYDRAESKRPAAPLLAALVTG